MAQNTSSAVMQQRVEAHDSLDDFPTPCWATRALLYVLARDRILMPADAARMTAAEPCANRGFMVKPLAETFHHVIASDIMDYGMGYAVNDYLFPGRLPEADWTFMNPPFRLAEQFIARSFETPFWHGTAVLVRSAFVESIDRYNALFGPNPPAIEAHFAERVIMTKGRLLDPDQPYWDEVEQKLKRPSTATAYSWLVWLRQAPWAGCRTIWIPPCRKLLTKEGDYPGNPEKPND